MAFNNFPYTNFQDLNLDWILRNVKNALENSADAVTAAEIASATATELKNFVNTYFDDLDVQEEINAKIDEMVESGEFAEIITSGDVAEAINDVVSTTVNSWLTNNVTPVGSAVVVDASLTISGAAADAKETGDRIAKLNSDLNKTVTVTIGDNLVDPDALTTGAIQTDGTITTTGAWGNYETSDFIALDENTDYIAEIFRKDDFTISNNRKVILFFDGSKTPITESYINTSGSNVTSFNSGTNYK